MLSSRNNVYRDQIGELCYAIGHDPHMALGGSAANDVFGPPTRISISSSPNLSLSSSVLTGSSSVLELPSSILEAGEATKRDAEGRILTPKLELPLLDDLSKLSPVFRARLEAMAALPRTKKKLPREQLREVLINLCRDQFVCLRALAELVGRKPDALRNEYLTPMVRDVVMALAFPKTPTHELQAYRSQPRPLKAGDS